MANPKDRFPSNVPGAFYVDDTCIDCDQCHSIAPQFFRRDDVNAHSYVHCQPVTLEEFALAREAMEGCPTETIGDDGEAAVSVAS